MALYITDSVMYRFSIEMAMETRKGCGIWGISRLKGWSLILKRQKTIRVAAKNKQNNMKT